MTYQPQKEALVTSWDNAACDPLKPIAVTIGLGFDLILKTGQSGGSRLRRCVTAPDDGGGSEIFSDVGDDESVRARSALNCCERSVHAQCLPASAESEQLQGEQRQAAAAAGIICRLGDRNDAT